MTLSFSQLKLILLRTFRRFQEDDCYRFGAAIAYFSVFSLVPLLLIVIMIAGAFLGTETVRAHILLETRGYLGAEGAEFLSETLRAAREERLGAGLTILSMLLAFVGSLAVFRELKEALHRIFDLEPEGGGIIAFLRKNVLLFGMVLAMGFLLLMSLVISAFITLANRFFSELLLLPPFFWESLNFLISFGITAGLFALLYRFLPNRRLPWRYVRFGAIITALLFTMGKSLIGFYLGQSEPASAYGAAGTLVLILLWMYYSSQVVLFGAELTAVYATEHGHLARRAEVVSPSNKTSRTRRGVLSKVAGLVIFFLLRRFLRRFFRKF